MGGSSWTPSQSTTCHFPGHQDAYPEVRSLPPGTSHLGGAPHRNASPGSDWLEMADASLSERALYGLRLIPQLKKVLRWVAAGSFTRTEPYPGFTFCEPHTPPHRTANRPRRKGSRMAVCPAKDPDRGVPGSAPSLPSNGQHQVGTQGQHTRGRVLRNRRPRLQALHSKQ